MDQGGPGGPWGPKPPLVDQEGFLHFADVVFTQLGRKKAQTDKLIKDERRCSRKFAELKDVHTQVKFAYLLVRYSGSIELVCIP